ncbi:DUF1329 domain-containing protein [Amphritea sp.]|uniref:DUF1329 domain-containing protein n=1 Tax=Amphritea sp. TaxID=1872502 RepID=UPI003A8EA679
MIKIIKNSALTMAVALTCSSTAFAVSEQEAARLGQDLTPLGAEKAGNASGTIPAWTGGYKGGNPEGYVSGQPRKDLFPEDKPRLVITSSNYKEHLDKLNAGIVKLFETYDDFRMDIYPTRRTGMAPQEVYEATKKNAITATTSHNGYLLENAIGGIPFPIPSTGLEAMWNHLTSYRGKSTHDYFRTYVVPPNGEKVLASGTSQHWIYPYYGEGSFDGNAFAKAALENLEPSYKVGEAMLVYETLDNSINGRKAWQYMAGQRRVRRTPSLGYDTPDFVTSGSAFFDEAYIFSGGMNRFNWKLVGKKELYVPYNNNGYLEHSDDQTIGKHFLNPDYVRWELHRVWEVEATLAEGQRHAVAKRKLYLDEDTWLALLVDGWDSNGELWRMSYGLPIVIPEGEFVVFRPWGTYDFIKGSYLVNGQLNEGDAQMSVTEPKSERYFTPKALASRSLR